MARTLARHSPVPRHGLGQHHHPPLQVNILTIFQTLTLLNTHTVHRLLTVWSCPRLFPQASCISLAAASSLIFRDVLIPSFSTETDLLCRRCAELLWRLPCPIPLARYVIRCALPSSEGVQPTEFDHPPLHSRVTRSSVVCLQTPCDRHPLCSARLFYSSFLFRMAAGSNHSAIGNSAQTAQPPSRYDYPSFYFPPDCKLYLVAEHPQRKYADHMKTILASPKRTRHHTSMWRADLRNRS